MKYIILSSDTSAKLESKVNNFLSEGWECQGGLSVFVAASGYWSYNQAMVTRVK